MSQPPSNPPSPPPPGTRRTTLGQFLVFIGPIIFAGGFLAIWRTGERNWFYGTLGVLGMLLWGLGVFLLRQRKN